MTNRNPNYDDAAWVSLFSVPLHRIRPHFWTFSACFIATLIFYIVVHTITIENATWRQTPSLVMADTARAGAFWLFASPILLEVAIMVFAALYNHEKREEGRRKGREEGIAEGREEGIAQANAAWRGWNDRRLAAEANGEPFTEPPPDATNNSPSGASESATQTPT